MLLALTLSRSKGHLMAKRSNDPIYVADKAKVRVLFAEVEGNNESVQEALKTIVLAMGRPARVIPEGKASGNATVLLAQGNSEEFDESAEPVDVADLIAEESVSVATRKPRGTGKKRDRNAGLSLVPDLDFRPSGERPLKEFMGDRNPKDDIEATLVTVYYMQHKMNLSKIGPAHVMTAFKEAGKSIPADVRQTLRNVKSSKMWLNFSDLDDVRTTTQGDNHVEHDMSKGNAP
jgi:hypothetical protein